MSTTMPRPRMGPTMSMPATAPTPPKLGRVSTDDKLPPRIVLNAVEGWGKTTFGAYAPNPAVLMSRGESGYVTLRQAGLVPDADQVELTKWTDVLATVESIGDGDYGSLILDALGGFERLCHEHVCARDFNNDWGDRGFGSFQKGYDVSVAEWLQLLNRLDAIRIKRHIPIVFLSHSKVKPFKNPLGTDFDRYVADCHDKTWSVTHKWADVVMFGTFITVVKEERGKKAKGIGGDERVVYTTRRDGFDAKNRYAMPPSIAIPSEPSAVYSTIMSAIAGGAAADDAIPE